MLARGVTLRGLEVFEALAAAGTVAGAADRTGLSQPAVSQQMRNLEQALGVALVDHARRPMQLTPAGRGFLARTRSVLAELRLAQNELSGMDLAHLGSLGLGVIDDFDDELTPRLVSVLAASMTRCRFRLITAPSHELVDAIDARRLDLAIVATDGAPPTGLVEAPLVRDPFIFVCPAGQVAERGGIAAVMQALPLLRHDREQLIGRQVEAWLARQDLRFAERFEIGAHLSLMTLVARGLGWTITTSLGYMRAARLHDATEAHPLSEPGFARTIALLAAPDWADAVPLEVADTARRLIAEMVLAPAQARLPWLGDTLRLL